jgi:amidase
MINVFSSTTQLAAAIRAGHISATEALAAHLVQIERHNPALNAVVTADAEGAHARAREADEALARGQVWGPLHGVPFTLKDAFATAAMRTTVGFPPWAEQVPEADSTVVARLKGAGAILMGKTNAAMLLADHQTGNPIFGRTNNPWDVARTPGGSSGGAAAALAAGMTPFEIGTDMAASIRLPSHFCGLFGLKPTEHRVSLAGVVPAPGDTPPPVRILSCVGPMARTVDDLALLYRIIAGPSERVVAGQDGRDTDVPPVPAGELPELDLAQLRIAYFQTFPGLPVAASIRTAVEVLAQQLTRQGARVEAAAPPDLDFNDDLAHAGELIGMIAGAFEEDGAESPTTLARYLHALHRRDRSILAWERFFQDWDALLCPPSMVTAFPHCEPGTPLQVDGQEVSYWMVSAYGTVFNYSGHPAVVLPYTLDADGLPIGVQLVGKRWDEARLLAVARAVAQVSGPFRPPPGYA